MEKKLKKIISHASKLNDNLTEKCVRDYLIRYIRECPKSSPRSTLLEISKQYYMDVERDIYGNQRCDLLKTSAVRSRSSINILKFFKPGEILSTVTTR